MSWVRVDDKTWSHPKFAGLSGNAARLWLFALCWCNQQGTDGFVPRSMLRALRGSSADASGLVAAGLWAQEPDGWRFHDYLEYQPSRQQLEEQRTSTKDRVSRFRERQRNAVTEPFGNAPCNAPVQLPQPNPTQPNTDPPVSPPRGDGLRPKVLEVFEGWKRDTGHSNAVLDAKRAKRIEARLRQGFTPDQLVTAIGHRRNDPFLMGQNDGGRVFDGIETLLRDAAQVERLLGLTQPMQAKPNGRAYPTIPGLEEHNVHKQALGARIGQSVWGRRKEQA